MHALVTGGLGFIGSQVAARLLEDGHRVTVLDNHASPVVADVSGAGVITADVTDAGATEALDVPPADCVLHLGGPSSGPASARDPVGTMAASYAGTLNVLELSRRLGVRRFVYASSMTVYGDVEQVPVTEETPCQPRSHYGIAKFACERLVELQCRQNGVGYNSLRVFNVYGPGQDLSRTDQGLVSIFLAMLLKGPDIVSKGTLDRVRDVVHIDDVVEAFVRCAASANVDGPLNVASGSGITIGELIAEMADELGLTKRLNVTVADGTPGDIQTIEADISALIAATGFRPRFDPPTGVRRFARWAAEQPATAVAG